jgi:hypothetical protein
MALTTMGKHSRRFWMPTCAGLLETRRRAADGGDKTHVRHVLATMDDAC